MKKIVFIFLCLFININVFAEEIEVKLSKCVDGDTAKFIYKDEVITARFLAIDTPESVHPTIGEEPYGKEASEYTCNSLKNASKIELEYDTDSDELEKAQEKAKAKKVGLWSDEVVKKTKKEEIIEGNESSINNVYDEKYSNVVFIAVIIALIIIFIFSEKGRKNIIKYCKKTIKKELKK